MKPEEFTRKLAATNLQTDSTTARACRMVLVDNATAYRAARHYKINESVVSRALAKIREARAVHKCPTCGGGI